MAFNGTMILAGLLLENFCDTLPSSTSSQLSGFTPCSCNNKMKSSITWSKDMEDYSNWSRAQTARVQLKIYNFKLISLIQWHDSVFSNTSLVQQ